MPDQHVDHLQPVLRGLAAGADPTKLLRDILQVAVVATRATEGGILRLVGHTATPAVTSGELSPSAAEAGRVAIDSGRLVRRRDPAGNATHAAEPLREGTRIIGALVVGGTMQRLDPAALPLYGAAASLVLGRQAAGAPATLRHLLDSLSHIASDLDTPRMLARIFDLVQNLFGTASGFCVLFDRGAVRVAHFRGIDKERMVLVAQQPDFKVLVSSRSMRIDPPTHPVVAQLARLSEVAVTLPLESEGSHLGQLVLLMATAPDSEQKEMLLSFSRHVGRCLRSAEMFRSLGDQQEQLTAMVHSMASPVVVVDESGHVTELNGAAAEAFRLAANFERNQPVAGRLGHKMLEQMLTNGDDQTAEVVIGGEKPRVYKATLRRIRASGGRLMGRILVLDDLTGEREMTTLKADFVAVIGHELRTPLTVMKGYLHSLIRRSDTMSDEKREQTLTAVKANVTRLERLIEDLLFISAIDKRRAQLDLELHDLGALLDARASDRVVVKLPNWPVEVELDQAKLDQVLNHLLDNALKYSEGQVSLELVERPDIYEIAVTDAGPGIFSGDIPQLFERFRQLDGSSTRTHGGVGIGLYIARRVVEAMGGRIWCESRLGVGSRFAFSMPRNRAAAVAQGAPARPGNSLP
ncbi:MAG TPA: ATP-binding protein [Acidimicrobiales bacterium]|nr:ATP-binding protein [Acidimicrobiales bacterium]